MKEESKAAKRFCPKCNTLLLESDTVCPACKREVKKLDAAITKGFNLFLGLLLFIGLIAFIALIGYLFKTNRELLLIYFIRIVNFFR